MAQLLEIERGDLRLAATMVGNGPPLIWAHGLMATKELTLDILNGLSNYTVLSYDQRGHGGSSPIHDRSLYDLNLMAEDIGAWMDRVGWRAAVVGGDSMGATIAAQFAVLHPQRVTGLVLDIPAIGQQPNSALDADSNAKLLRKGGLEAYINARLSKVPTDQQAPFGRRLNFMRVHDPSSVACAYEAVGGWQFDTSETRRIVVPTSIRAWPDDPIHPIALARELADTIPNAVLYVVSSELNSNVSANRVSLAAILSDLEERISASKTKGGTNVRD